VLDLSAVSPGLRVQHELMVRSREDKTTRNGDPFAVLQLGNATGVISTNVWREQLPWIEGVKAGSIVQAIGAVETYQGRRQLKLTAPLRVVAPVAANLDEFLPRIAVEPPRLWAQVDAWRSEMRANKLRMAVDLFFADDVFRTSFERAPGASRGHHAQIGGLLMHLVEVGTVARGAARTMHASVDLVTAGALLHDIGKVEAFTIDATGFGHTTAGAVLRPVALGSLMLDRRLRTLPPGTLSEAQELELQHFILSATDHPAAAHPMTLEAELLQRADQMSATGSAFLEAIGDPELFPGDGEFSVRLGAPLDRKVWRRAHDWD